VRSRLGVPDRLEQLGGDHVLARNVECARTILEVGASAHAVLQLRVDPHEVGLVAIVDDVVTVVSGEGADSFKPS